MSLTRRVFLERIAQIGGYSAAFRTMQVLGLTTAAGASPLPDAAEYVFVRRDGGLLFAVAYSWDNGMLRYVTRDGFRRSVTQDALDLDATQQFNEQRGLSFRLPA